MIINKSSKRKDAFSLIEVLVVMGIIAVIALVVVYTLNPKGIINQGYDGNRIAGLGSLDKAISLYYSDAMSNPNTLNMGSSSIVYVSIPDPTATTTAGTNCSGVGLFSATITYHCASISNYLNVDGTGWVPIDFTKYSGGSPISNLPIDPINTTSSGEYYQYSTNGTQYELIAKSESSKSNYSAGDFIKGTNLALIPSNTYTTSTYVLGSNSTPWGIAFDSHTNTMWVGNKSTNQITQINDTTFATSTYAMSTPYGIAFDSHTNTIWVVNSLGATITQINDTTFATSTHALGGSPYGIAFDSHTNTMWVGDSRSATITQINDTTFATSTHALGGSSFGIAFDSYTNTMWTSNYLLGTITQINDTTFATSTYALGGSPYGIAFDSHTNTMWVGSYSNPQIITQINDTTFATSTYASGAFGSFGIAFDSHTNTMWSSNYLYNSITLITPNG